MTSNGDDVKSKVNKFEELEKSNALIDVWIDDEDYNSVYDHATGIKPSDDKLPNHNQTVEFYINACFPEVNKDQKEQEEYCTHDKDDDWQKALDCDKGALPVEKVGGNDLKEHEGDTIVQYWSHLFYAKLLRAKIQQKGSSDCYTRRLDDVAAYLERHLPQRTNSIKPEQKEWVTRLTVMYLMELSAVSLGGESQGFSERAQRFITDAKFDPNSAKASEKASYEFYDLWAHYNIGVAYFHQAYYRKAVLEFNEIIWQIKKDDKEFGETTQKDKAKRYLDFPNDNIGEELLLLPAELYRAEVQLKLQFAFHALQTLAEREEKNNSENYKGWKSEHKKIRAEIIRVQAYQQLGRLDKSWCALEEIYDRLGYGRLGERKDCTIPDYDNLNRNFPGLGERFVDILTADHLGWLTLEGEDEQSPAFRISRLVKGDESATKEKGDIVDAYIKAVTEFVDEDKSYPRKLEDAFSTYFEVVKHHAYNRRGYFQQLAKYLAWLAKVADFRYSDPDFAPGQQENKGVKDARDKIAGIAWCLYTKCKEDILFEEDKIDESQNDCRHCQARGIHLGRIDTEHYEWFTDAMLEFFNSESIMKINPRQLKKDKGRFVSRLIKLERKERDDLRIHDLKLRYEYYGKEELLKHCTKWWKMRKGMELCGKVSSLKDEEGFAGLLECARGNRGDQENCASTEHLTSDDYKKIMQEWDKDYLRQLRSPSTHENHQKDGFYFMGLQRWNSASPAKGFSVGGGYLLYHLNGKNKKVDMGIAIDPGFDFVRNLFHMGFSLYDIDIVLISHAHLDHIRDFESIVMLLSELEKRGRREKRVHVILSLGAYKRLEHIVEDPRFRYFVEPYIIDVDREINDDYFEKGLPEFRFKSVHGNKEHGNSNYMERFKAVLSKKDPDSDLWAKITPTRAYHDDKSRSDSFGFLIELREKNQDKLIFGYTGDTRWVYPNMPDPLERDSSKDKQEERKIEDIAGQYESCDVLLIHLGSLIGKDNNGKFSFAQYDQCSRNENEYRCEELVRENDHPYLIGMLRLLSSYYNCVSKGKPLVLVSEFGEELRGTIRSDFIRRLQEIYKNELAFLPVDVGMNVYLRKKGDEQDQSHGNRCACRVWCVQCNHFVNIDDAAFELYGTDHALYCVCKTCRKATPINVLQDRLRQLCEVGLELRTNDNK